MRNLCEWNMLNHIGSSSPTSLGTKPVQVSLDSSGQKPGHPNKWQWYKTLGRLVLSDLPSFSLQTLFSKPVFPVQKNIRHTCSNSAYDESCPEMAQISRRKATDCFFFFFFFTCSQSNIISSYLWDIFASKIIASFYLMVRTLYCKFYILYFVRLNCCCVTPHTNTLHQEHIISHHS